VPAGPGIRGRCINQNKYQVQDDKYNYHDSLQAHLIGGTGHLLSVLFRSISYNDLKILFVEETILLSGFRREIDSCRY